MLPPPPLPFAGVPELEPQPTTISPNEHPSPRSHEIAKPILAIFGWLGCTFKLLRSAHEGRVRIRTVILPAAPALARCGSAGDEPGVCYGIIRATDAETSSDSLRRCNDGLLTWA
jgi:hypothetical protein